MMDFDDSLNAEQGPGFVGTKFCRECNNMLYPKEDKETKRLLYAVSFKYSFSKIILSLF